MDEELIQEGRDALDALGRIAESCTDYYCNQDSPEHFDALDRCLDVLAKLVGHEDSDA